MNNFDEDLYSNGIRHKSKPSVKKDLSQTYREDYERYSKIDLTYFFNIILII